MNFVLEALRAAADPTRLRVVCLLDAGELTVSELVVVLVQSQPRVSRHLKILTDAGLLERFREGSHVFYRLSAGGDAVKITHSLIEMIPKNDAVCLQDRGRLREIERKRTEKASKINVLKCRPEIDRLRELGVDEFEVERAVCDMLPLTKAHRFLDLGTGTGHMLRLLGPYAGESLGLDKSSEVLAVARDTIRTCALRVDGALENCQVRQADILAVPLADNSFDAIVLHQVLHYLERPRGAIAEAARLLAPGGRLLVVDLAPHNAQDLHQTHAHIHLGFSDNDVREWLGGQGLVCETIRHLVGAHGTRRLSVTLWLAHKRDGNHKTVQKAVDKKRKQGVPS